VKDSLHFLISFVIFLVANVVGAVLIMRGAQVLYVIGCLGIVTAFGIIMIIMEIRIAKDEVLKALKQLSR
jgi:uncharacterized membrane protein YhhN